ncbi:hypothetical protein DFH27DRAFT_485027 [Peziza echinospora]|nr:hypothetical protein DFH27DRAFT_485027 [Peziza echinospora]
MRPALRLLASPALNPRTNLPLLPPLALYRRLLRAHRKHLPYDARALGDAYVKSEFRLHREVDNPIHVIGFLTEWQLYVQQLEGEGWRGARMERGKVEKMSDDQLMQMYEMLKILKGESSAGSSSSSSSDGTSTNNDPTSTADGNGTGTGSGKDGSGSNSKA